MSDICNICNMHGDLEVDHDYVFRDIFAFGILGELEAACYISDLNKDRTPILEVQYDLTDSNLCSTDLGVRRVPINFCPICGRDLRKEVSDGETT